MHLGIMHHQDLLGVKIHAYAVQYQLENLKILSTFQGLKNAHGRVSMHPGKLENAGYDLEFFSSLEFVLEFTIFRVLSWKSPGIFFV